MGVFNEVFGEKKPKIKDEAILHDSKDTLTVKDLSKCLYDEYQNMRALKAENESLRMQLNEYKKQEVIIDTQKVVINEGEQRLEECKRDVRNKEKDIVSLKNNVEELESQVGFLETANAKLRNAKPTDEIIDSILEYISEQKNIGKNKLIEFVSGLKIEEIKKHSEADIPN